MSKCASCQRGFPFTPAHLKAHGKYCTDCLTRIRAMAQTRISLRMRMEERDLAEQEVQDAMIEDKFDYFVELRTKTDRLDKDIIRLKNKLRGLIKSCPVYVELDIDKLLNQY